MIIEKDCKVDGVSIHYRIAGDKKNKTLVFLHGRPGSEYLNSSVIEEFAKDFYVIAPEHPGLLRSEPLKQYTNIFSQYAEVAHQVLVHEGLARTPHIIIGQSFGGIIASILAEKYPSQVEALIFTDALMGYQQQDLLRKTLFKYGRQIILTYLNSPNFIKVRGLKLYFGVISKDKSAKENRAMIGARVEMIDNCCSLFRQVMNQKINLLDKKYDNIPIIMLRGETDGERVRIAGYSKVEDAQKLYEKLKNKGNKVQFITVDGGHTIIYDNPSMIISEIKKALLK